MKRLCAHLGAVVILALVFPVLGAVRGPSGWGRLIASVDRPPDGSVHALFELNAPGARPFPSDWFTVPDHTQNTHRRVALEAPLDCTVRTEPSSSDPSERIVKLTTICCVKLLFTCRVQMSQTFRCTPARYQSPSGSVP